MSFNNWNTRILPLCVYGVNFQISYSNFPFYRLKSDFSCSMFEQYKTKSIFADMYHSLEMKISYNNINDSYYTLRFCAAVTSIYHIFFFRIHASYIKLLGNSRCVPLPQRWTPLITLIIGHWYLFVSIHNDNYEDIPWHRQHKYASQDIHFVVLYLFWNSYSHNWLINWYYLFTPIQQNCFTGYGSIHNNNYEDIPWHRQHKYASQDIHFVVLYLFWNSYSHN